ncbi:hypothetical protein Tco_0836216 [Tanacetum coccineum]
MHDESLKYVLSDNAIVALAEKVPVTEADISTTISQADTHLGFLNSNSTTGSPSSVVISHLVDFRFLLQGELQNPDEILQLYIKKHLGPNSSCPLSLYNYGLLSKSNIEVPKRLVSEENGYKFSMKSKEARIYANDGRLLCHSYLQRILAKLVDEDPPAIMLLFEPKGRTEIEVNKKNICVGCGEGNNYVRHHIIPSCYRIHLPEHLKTLRFNEKFLVCLDCREKANSFAEEYKKKVASDYGIPLFVHEVVNPSVSPLELLKTAKVLLRHGPRMPPQRREELTRVVRTYYGRREISDEDLKMLHYVETRKDECRKREAYLLIVPQKTPSQIRR